MRRGTRINDGGPQRFSLPTLIRVRSVALLREWAYRFSYNSSAERLRWLQPYLHFYNFHRAHSALACNAPVSRLDRKNVLKTQQLDGGSCVLVQEPWHPGTRFSTYVFAIDFIAAARCFFVRCEQSIWTG